MSATAEHSEASVEVTPVDADAVAAGHQVDLPVGETSINVAVKAEDGEPTATYSVAVMRRRAQMHLNHEKTGKSLSDGSVTYRTPADHTDLLEALAPQPEIVLRVFGPSPRRQGLGRQCRRGRGLLPGDVARLDVGRGHHRLPRRPRPPGGDTV